MRCRWCQAELPELPTPVTAGIMRSLPPHLRKQRKDHIMRLTMKLASHQWGECTDLRAGTLAVSKAAKELGMSTNGVRLMALRGDIPSVRATRGLRIPVEAVNRMKENAR